MGPWLETFGVAALAAGGLFAGLKVSRLRKRYWHVGYVLIFLPLMMVGVARNIGSLNFVLPFSWVVAGRNEFVIISFAAASLAGLVVPHLPGKRLKILVGIFLGICAVDYTVFWFLTPALMRGRHLSLETVMYDDVCAQSTSYTCGPAAAVTALRQVGVDGDEGELAVAARTTGVGGTDGDMLARAIRKLFGCEGVSCRYRYFDTIEQLRENCPTIAQIKYRFMIDHYVTVLEVTDKDVVVGNPLVGKERLSHEKFKEKWRFIGIVVNRQSHEASGVIGAKSR